MKKIAIHFFIQGISGLITGQTEEGLRDLALGIDCLIPKEVLKNKLSIRIVLRVEKVKEKQ